MGSAKRKLLSILLIVLFLLSACAPAAQNGAQEAPGYNNWDNEFL